MTDSVRHMQVCMLLHWGPHLIGIKVSISEEYAVLDFYYTCICLLQTTRRCERSVVWQNVTQHVLVSAGISRLIDTCLPGIHNANYIVKSIVCAVILVRGSRVPAYGIRPTHGPIHVLDVLGTGTKHIVRHS